MKKLFLLPSLFLLLSYVTSANSSSIAKGVFYNLKNEAIHGHFEIPTEYINKQVLKEFIHWKIKFASPDQGPQTLSPQNCKGFHFEYKGKIIEFARIKNEFNWKNPFNESNDFVFVEIIVDENIRLFEFSHKAYDSGMFYENGQGGVSSSGGGGVFIKTEKIIQKGDQYFLVQKLNCKKQLINIFEDEPEVIAFLKKESKIWKNIAIIIQKINQI